MEFRADDRVDPPLEADEKTMLMAFLAYQRDTLRWKCAGLTSEQLNQPLPPSTLTLGGLLKHLVLVESWWLNQRFAGGHTKPSWLDGADLDDPEWEFKTAADDSPEQLFAWLQETQDVSEQIVGEADLGAVSQEKTDAGRRFSLRWILCHLVEEYARHNGHADLIRESIDGATGE